MLVMKENWEETRAVDKQTEANTLSPTHSMAQETVSEVDYNNNSYFYGFM